MEELFSNLFWISAGDLVHQKITKMHEYLAAEGSCLAVCASACNRTKAERIRPFDRRMIKTFRKKPERPGWKYLAEAVSKNNESLSKAQCRAALNTHAWWHVIDPINRKSADDYHMRNKETSMTWNQIKGTETGPEKKTRIQMKIKRRNKNKNELHINWWQGQTSWSSHTWASKWASVEDGHEDPVKDGGCNFQRESGDMSHLKGKYI